ncbi:MAG TPA: M3 family metallopeptidase [Steroidobacteraceae bacterium]|nr:M3 family metallopeptidase [Steroidobacteraceae bacterium]
MKDNPFDQPSTLPYQLPPFAQIHDADYLPAFTAGMAQQLREVAAIANDPAAPTFANTVVALERSGALLNRVNKVFFNLSSSNTDPAMEKIEQEIAPKLSVHQDAIWLNPKLFARFETLHEHAATLHLDPESQQLLDRYYLGFVRAGARLDDADKARLRAMNERLATLATQFRLNVLKATQDAAVQVDSEQELAGLSPAQISAAATAAKARNLTGKYLLTLQNTVMQPILANLSDRALRERVFHASENRATSGATDNRPVIAETIRLRAERAQLLGYPNHAAFVLADNMAMTPAAVNDMLGRIAPIAAAAARREGAEIQQIIDEEAKAAGRPGFKLQPWDWDYYADHVRMSNYNFDQNTVKPYFELEHVLKDGLFYAAHEMYGITFRERKDLKAYRDDVRVFEVSNADGSKLGLFLADYYARDNKQGGAWMNTFVDQSHLLHRLPVVVNNVNLNQPASGQPTLLTFDEVTTLFHEFGHALHGLFSNVEYPTLSGINVPTDFGEYPSQFNEMWAREPAVLAHFAHHYQTGKPMPSELFDKVLAAARFGQGFITTSYVAAAMLDQSWHQIGVQQAPAADQVMNFEAAALKQSGTEVQGVPVRYRSPIFLHIFSGGYDAGYYAYLWSEVLARDTGQWLHTHGGISRANGDYLRAKILSRGRSEEPQQLFEEFYGKPADIGPLMEYRGLDSKP